MRKLWIALSILLFLFSLSVGHMFFQLRNANQERKHHEQITQEQADRIIFLVNAITKQADQLKKQLQNTHAKNINFQENARILSEAVLAETGVSLKNVAIAPRGKISEIYPRVGNESLIGFDFLDRKKSETEQAKNAFRLGISRLANPSDRDGNFIGYRAPVVWNVKGEQKFWGLVTLAVDFEDFCRAAEIDELEAQGLNYRLSCITFNGTPRILREKGTFDGRTDVIRIFFRMKNLSWKLETVPKDDLPAASLYGIGGAVIFGLAIFCLIGLAVKKQRIPESETD